MPLKYNGKIYKTWNGLVKAIRKKHPVWTDDRIKRYAGTIKHRQEGKKRKT